jgi:hypothetical protein
VRAEFGVIALRSDFVASKGFQKALSRGDENKQEKAMQNGTMARRSVEASLMRIWS